MEDEGVFADLRERVVAAVEDEGVSRREAMRRYRIGEGTAVHWLQAVRQGRRRVATGVRAFQAWRPRLIEWSRT